jgi:hypothetical protein
MRVTGKAARRLAESRENVTRELRFGALFPATGQESLASRCNRAARLEEHER